MHLDNGISPSCRKGSPGEMAAILQDIRLALDADPVLAHHHLDRLSAALDLQTGDRGLLDRARLPDRPVFHTQTTRGGLAGWQIRRVCHHIERHIDSPISTATLAASIDVSTGHFCRAFKVSIGETPHNYVIRQRLRQAQTLMIQTRDMLSQIAFACGMTDQAHLTRLFRRFVGTTPTAWRRHWQDAGPPDALPQRAQDRPNPVMLRQDMPRL